MQKLSLGFCREWRPRSACASVQPDQGLHCPQTEPLDTRECFSWEQIPGPSCSKLTTSLVSDSLKFTSSDTQIRWNFLLKKMCIAKATHIFSAKNIRILCIESAKTVNEMTLKELIKLTMLWTTGPWIRLRMCKMMWICICCACLKAAAQLGTCEIGIYTQWHVLHVSR